MLRIHEVKRTSFWKSFNETRPRITPVETAVAPTETAAYTDAHTETTHGTKKSFWETFKYESNSLLTSVRPFVEKLADSAAWIGTGATFLAFQFAPVVAFSQVALWTVAIWGANRLIRSNTAAASGGTHH